MPKQAVYQLVLANLQAVVKLR